jgi:hypothetical protein
MAFLAAIFLVPRARQVVITTARPSGIAATANATAILNCKLVDRELERGAYVVDGASEPAVVRWIGKMAVVDEPDEDTDDSDDFG